MTTNRAGHQKGMTQDVSGPHSPPNQDRRSRNQVKKPKMTIATKPTRACQNHPMRALDVSCINSPLSLFGSHKKNRKTLKHFQDISDLFMSERKLRESTIFKHVKIRCSPIVKPEDQLIREVDQAPPDLLPHSPMKLQLLAQGALPLLIPQDTSVPPISGDVPRTTVARLKQGH